MATFKRAAKSSSPRKIGFLTNRMLPDRDWIVARYSGTKKKPTYERIGNLSMAALRQLKRDCVKAAVLSSVIDKLLKLKQRHRRST